MRQWGFFATPADSVCDGFESSEKFCCACPTPVASVGIAIHIVLGGHGTIAGPSLSARRLSPSLQVLCVCLFGIRDCSSLTRAALGHRGTVDAQEAASVTMAGGVFCHVQWAAVGRGKSGRMRRDRRPASSFLSDGPCRTRTGFRCLFRMAPSGLALLLDDLVAFGCRLNRLTSFAVRRRDKKR
jgi:hypothetical protein